MHLYTRGSVRMSKEEDVKGTLENGMYADFTILFEDYFSVREEQIKSLEAMLTMVDGKVVFGSKEYQEMNPPLPTIIPEWSKVNIMVVFKENKILTL